MENDKRKILVNRGRVYRQFVDHCREKVKKLTESFDSWHLFHKSGEEYVLKEDGIQFTYKMLRQEGRWNKEDGFE